MTSHFKFWFAEILKADFPKAELGLAIDVFSFGVRTLLKLSCTHMPQVTFGELFTGKQPQRSKLQQLVEMKECPHEPYDLYSSCVDEDPRKRPLMVQVVQQLSQIMNNDATEYFQENLHSVGQLSLSGTCILTPLKSLIPFNIPPTICVFPRPDSPPSHIPPAYQNVENAASTTRELREIFQLQLRTPVVVVRLLSVQSNLLNYSFLVHENRVH